MSWSNKSINQFVDHLIQYDGRKNSEGHYVLHFDELCIDDRGHLVTLFLDRDGRDMFSFYENDEFEIIVGKFIGYLEIENDRRAFEFAQSMKNNVIKYYSKQIQELINERCGYMEQEELMEHGYRRDQFTGEVVRC